MNRKGQLAMGGILLFFIGVVIAFALFPAIADGQSTMTTKNVITNEVISIASLKPSAGENSFNVTTDSINVTVTNVPSGYKITECPLTNVVVSNASGHDLTVTTDYTIDAVTGNIFIVNNSDTILDFDTNNDSLVDYTICLDGYIPEAGGRSIAGLIMIFAAIGLLGFVIYYGVSATGLLNN